MIDFRFVIINLKKEFQKNRNNFNFNFKYLTKIMEELNDYLLSHTENFNLGLGRAAKPVYYEN